MKKSIITATLFILITILYTIGCKPNGNNNSTDAENRLGERLDTAHLIDNASPSAYQTDTSAHADTTAAKPGGH